MSDKTPPPSLPTRSVRPLAALDHHGMSEALGEPVNRGLPTFDRTGTLEGVGRPDAYRPDGVGRGAGRGCGHLIGTGRGEVGAGRAGPFGMIFFTSPS
jgi:hypothetical protein